MMKRFFALILLSLCLTVSGPVRAQNGSSKSSAILRFLAEQRLLRTAGLATLVSKRCYRYLSTLTAMGCDLAALDMINHLDIDIQFMNDGSGADGEMPNFFFIAFKKQLIKALNTAETTSYLSNLQNELSRVLKTQKFDFNLWQHTLKHTRQDKKEAARLIAVLLQDTSFAQTHVQFLEEFNVQGNENFALNKSLLSGVLYSIGELSEKNNKQFRSLFFPQGEGQSFNDSIYHFYVPYYMAGKIKSMGYTSNVAKVTAFMLTATYEFISVETDFTYLFDDPKNLAGSRFDWKLRDIFSGYRGATLGAGAAVEHVEQKSMAQAFARSTKEGMKLLTR